MIIAARLQVKGGSFRDLPLTTELSDSLGGWFAFLESFKTDENDSDEILTQGLSATRQRLWLR